MPQHRRSFGCIQRISKNSYRLRWTDGGRRKSQTFYGTRQEAERRMAEIHLSIDPHKRHVQTVAAIYTALVYPEYVRSSAPRTLANIESCYSRHIEPRWGSVPVDDVRPADFQAWLLEVPAGSAKKSLSIMRAVMRHAVMLDMITASHLNMSFELPAGREVSHDIIHGLEGIDAYHAAVRGSWVEPAFILGACAGLRPGEMLGIKVGEVEPCAVGAVVEVCRQVDDVGRIATNADGSERTKTAGSHRWAVILEPYAARLLELQDAAKRAGDVYLTDDGTGNPVGKSALRREWERILDAADLQRILLRNLRPTFATSAHHDLGLQTEDVARLLGHTKPVITYATYERPDKNNILNAIQNSIGAQKIKDK